MPEKTSLALIVPCYNEADSMSFFETELAGFSRKFAAEFPDCQLSVLAIDNNSTDDSNHLLREIAGRLPQLQVHSCSKQGYGAALKHGFALAQADYLAFLDLDNTYPMLQLIDMFKIAVSESPDIVYGARLHQKSEIGFIRKAGNLFYVHLLKLILNSSLSDACSGMRVFRASKKQEVLSLKKDDLSFSIEFTVHVILRGWKTAEFPVPYRDRVGQSKLSVFRDGLIFLYVVLAKALRKKQ